MNREHIKQLAISMARESGLINLSRRELSRRAGIPDGSFRHFTGGNLEDLKDEIRADVGDVVPRVVVRQRMNPRLRKAHILGAATELAEIRGYSQLTCVGVAKYAKLSASAVKMYFDGPRGLQAAVMEHCVVAGVVPIVAQGLAVGDPIATGASPALKALAARHIANS